MGRVRMIWRVRIVVRMIEYNVDWTCRVETIVYGLRERYAAAERNAVGYTLELATLAPFQT